MKTYAESVREWDFHFLRQLESIKPKSKDPSTKVGALIVDPDNITVMQGFNGFAMGVKDSIEEYPERYERPMKYDLTIHAEHNAILLNSRVGGRSLVGCKIYSSLHPCVPCANAIIQSGIKEVITFRESKDDIARLSTDFNFNLAKVLFKEAGVDVIEYTMEEVWATME